MLVIELAQFFGLSFFHSLLSDLYTYRYLLGTLTIPCKANTKSSFTRCVLQQQVSAAVFYVVIEHDHKVGRKL